MGILSTTDNLLTLYRHAIGTTRVPMALHDWCAIAGIAACLEDRVWIPKLGDKLFPNLWTFMFAPSAAGKGTAIKELMKYIGPLSNEGHLNLFYGPVTAQAFKKRMAGKPKDGEPHHKSKQFLVNEEAAECIRSGSMAQDFIVSMTAQYSIPQGVVYRTETVTNGQANIYDGCINWLLGSNMDWAIKAIPQDLLNGGFLGRILPVIISDFDPRNKKKGKRPDDYEEVFGYLREAFEELTEIEGEIHVTRRAIELHDRWDEQRKIPNDDRLRATYVRMDDNVWKMSQVFAVAEDHQNPSVCERHMQQAINASTALIPGAKLVLDAAGVTNRTIEYELLLKIMRNHGGVIRHSVLMQRCAAQGIDKYGMLKALDMMDHAGKLQKHTIPSAGSRTAKGYSIKARW